MPICVIYFLSPVQTLFMTEDHKIVKNADFLNPAFLPKVLLFREGVEGQVFLSVSQRVNTFLYGSEGAGKTALTKRVISKLNDQRITGLYIDCSLSQTSTSVLREVLYKLWDTIGSFRGIVSRSRSEMICRLRQKIGKIKPVVCLDDIEYLKEMETVHLLINLGLTVLLISRQTRIFLKIDKQTRSRITNFVKLPDYSQEETREIVSSWVEDTLHESSYSQGFIKKLVGICKGNITLAKNLVRDAVLRAEARGSRTVGPEDIRFLPVLNFELNPDERIIFKILEKERKMESRALFETYRERVSYPKGERSFRNYMRHLCDRRLVRPIQIGKRRWYEIV